MFLIYCLYSNLCNWYFCPQVSSEEKTVRMFCSSVGFACGQQRTMGDNWMHTYKIIHTYSRQTPTRSVACSDGFVVFYSLEPLKEICILFFQCELRNRGSPQEILLIELWNGIKGEQYSKSFRSASWIMQLKGCETGKTWDSQVFPVQLSWNVTANYLPWTSFFFFSLWIPAWFH